MGLTKNQIDEMGHKRTLCDYCGTAFTLGYESELGDFCSFECETAETADRGDLYYESWMDDDERRADIMIDTQREKDMQ